MCITCILLFSIFFKIIEQFGSQKVEASHIERIAKLSGKPVHHFLKRGIFFSQRLVTVESDF
jgi:tryptophanyl-tRNA synthetase